MASLDEQLRQDAASLHRFVTSIAEHCERKSAAATYNEPAEKFFRYIVALSESTKGYLQDTLENTSDAAELLDFRKEIATLRAGWKSLHQFVKPVVDADTLHLPTSLIDALTRRVHQLASFEDVDFVVYHTDVFNYFNVKLHILKPDANKIGTIVGGPEFPERLGIIGIPYSQSSAIFMNCLIPHEMGHFVFGEKGLATTFRAEFEKELINRFGVAFDPNNRLILIERLLYWLEEIFCDCFAVRIIGFCYTLAFIELFDVAVVLDENGQLSASGKNIEFDLYPPYLFRIQQQLTILDADGWLKAFSSLDSHYASAAVAASTADKATFTCPDLGLWSGIVLQVLYDLMPRLKDELDLLSTGLQAAADIYDKERQLIQNHLAVGVVPSTVFSKSEDRFVNPSPISLLNAATQFYTQSLQMLFSNIEGLDPTNIEQRTLWTTRIESWISKSIEDVNLLADRKI